MARIFIISNRVAIPKAGIQPGGLEVVLKSTLKKHPCVWLGWSGEGFAEGELAAVRSMLRSKANSIEGGSSEINLNVVSKRVLGLPDPKS